MATALLRQSFYRVLLDLIKADDIITIDELNGLEEVEQRFHISAQDKADACRMTLAQACSCILSQKPNIKDTIRRTMLNIAIRDGECCRAESLLLTMMDYICDGNASVVSMETRNRQLISSQILYLEDSTTLPSISSLDEDYDRINNIVKLGGLELIYIPKVAEHFRRCDTDEDLRRLLSLVSPLSNSSDLDNTIMAIRGMTTRFFYRNVIRGKLEMDVNIQDPSWIIRIPDSSVAGINYANFLCIKADTDVHSQLVEFVSRLNSRQGSYSVKVNDAKGKDNSFMYNGFYKALLDLMSVKVIDKWDIHFRLYGEGVEVFKYINDSGRPARSVVTITRGAEEYALPLTGRDAAFYLLLLCASAEGNGINFRDQKLSKKVQQQYGLLFRALSRRSDEPSVWDPVFRVPMKSRVCGAIQESGIARISSLQDIYMPMPVEPGVLRVAIEADRVILETNKGGIPLKDSALYKAYLELR